MAKKKKKLPEKWKPHPWEKCEGNKNGKHIPDPLSATQAQKAEFVVDYCCKNCSWTGSARIIPEEISWD